MPPSFYSQRERIGPCRVLSRASQASQRGLLCAHDQEPEEEPAGLQREGLH